MYAIPITTLHLLALLAFVPWLFTWTGLVAMLVGVQVFGKAMTICYHRLLTHKSFKTYKWLEHTWVMFALCCLQDTPAKWVANHRFHHTHSDEQPDPHSPLVSFLWSHVGWLFYYNRETRSASMLEKHARDILRDPFYLAMEKHPIAELTYVAHALLYFAVGLITGWAYAGSYLAGLQLGLSLLVWGVILRTVIVWHITWSVNSLTHLFGYRNYETQEGSRNNWFVALLTSGEGWHNNHHYDQASATVQHRWWELDTNYYTIKLLERLGLAYDVISPKHMRRAARDATRDH